MAEMNLSKNLDKKTQEEIAAIKDDMQDIVHRVGNLKGEALKELVYQSGNLLSTLHDLKGKVSEHCDEHFKSMADCVQKNPIKCMAYCVGIGAFLMMLFKK